VAPSCISLAWPTNTVCAVPTSPPGAGDGAEAEAGASFWPHRPQKPKPAGLWNPHALHGGGGAKAIGNAAPPFDAAAVGPLPEIGALAEGGVAPGVATGGGGGGREEGEGGAVTDAGRGATVPPLIGSPGWPGGLAGPRKGGGGVEDDVEGGGGGAGRAGGGPAAPKPPGAAGGGAAAGAAAGAPADAPWGSFEPQPRQNL